MMRESNESRFVGFSIENKIINKCKIGILNINT